MTLKLNAELFTVESNDPQHNRRAVAALHETWATHGAAVVPDAVWRRFLGWSARPEVLEAASRSCSDIGSVGGRSGGFACAVSFQI